MLGGMLHDTGLGTSVPVRGPLPLHRNYGRMCVVPAAVCTRVLSRAVHSTCFKVSAAVCRVPASIPSRVGTFPATFPSPVLTGVCTQEDGAVATARSTQHSDLLCRLLAQELRCPGRQLTRDSSLLTWELTWAGHLGGLFGRILRGMMEMERTLPAPLELRKGGLGPACPIDTPTFTWPPC